MGLKESGLRASLRNVSTGVIAIPDSEANQKLLHRWLLDDVNGNVDDSEGNADGTNNGVVSVSGSFVGGSAGAGDGSSAHIDTSPLGTFGSNMSSNFAVAFSIKADNITSENRLLGVGNSGDDTFLFIQTGVKGPAADGAIEFAIRDASDNEIAVFTDSTFDDNREFRVVCNKTGNAASDMEVYVNQNIEQTTVESGESFSNPSDFDVNFFLFAVNNGGSLLQPANVILDDICLFNDSLTQAEIESYQNPWEN